jgi:hypothetical protein
MGGMHAHPTWWAALSPQLRDRLFSGQVPPWPEARRASEQGQAIAQHFGVPFHFASPEAPDVDLPRWWDTPPT